MLISAGAKILGNIRVGRCQVGAGSVVLEDVPAHTTVAGVRRKVVGVRPATSPRWRWITILLRRGRRK